MIRNGVNQLLNQPWLSIAPGTAIFAVVLAFNMIGDGLRDILDPEPWTDRDPRGDDEKYARKFAIPGNLG